MKRVAEGMSKLTSAWSYLKAKLKLCHFGLVPHPFLMA